jgi:AraC-like DNA-binding protein
VLFSSSPSRDAAETAKSPGVRAARLHAIKTDILNGLSRQDLSLAGLAARHGVTTRYVQMLFESEGTTFSRFLLDRRLSRAHRMLSDPRLAERTISAIAYEAGFGDSRISIARFAVGMVKRRPMCVRPQGEATAERNARSTSRRRILRGLLNPNDLLRAVHRLNLEPETSPAHRPQP